MPRRLPSIRLAAVLMMLGALFGAEPPAFGGGVTLEPIMLEPSMLEPITLEPITLEPITLEPITLEPITIPARRAPAALQGLHAPADLVPADVTLFVQLDDAAALRRRPAGRSIVGAIEQSLAVGPIGAAWARLARGIGVKPSALFDRICGERCALATRPRQGGSEGEARTWVLLAELEPSVLERCVKPLRPRRLAPRHDLAVVEIPEHALLVACSGTVAVFGPSTAPELFDEALALLAGDARAEPLSTSPPAVRGSSLFQDRSPSMTVLVRHDLPLGGWSAIAAAADEGQIVVRHAAEFVQSPFTRPVPARPWQPAGLASLEQGALAAIVEPAEIGLPTQDFLESITGEPLLDQDARRDLGLRHVLILGEAEGRLEDDPVDLMVPTFAIAIEVDPELDAGTADAVLDRNVVRLSKAIIRLGQGTFDLELPRLRHRQDPGPPTRRIDLEPAAAWLAPGFPALRGVSLNWQRVDGPHGRFWVVASHPQLLESTVAAFERPAPAPHVDARAWSSCGSLNGRRAALHLRSWADNVDAIAPGAPAEAVDDFRATAELFAALSDGMRRCRWTLARPTASSMDLEVTLELPAPTTGR